MSFNDFCEQKAAMIVLSLDKGINPFSLPFHSGYVNPVSGSFYNGQNPMWLSFFNRINGFTSPYFVTWKNAAALAAAQKVDRFISTENAKKFCPLVKWGVSQKEKKDKMGNVVYKDGKPEIEDSMFFSPFSVYNIEQFPLLDFTELLKPYESAKNEIPDVRAMLDTYIDKVGITKKLSADGAFYSKSDDSINMPSINRFKDAESYHMVEAHELGHSTGISKRLKRECYANYHADRRERAKEELIVQIFACSFAGFMKIDNPNVDGFTEDYVKDWASLLTEKPKMIYDAAKESVRIFEFMFPDVIAEQKARAIANKKEYVKPERKAKKGASKFKTKSKAKVAAR